MAEPSSGPTEKQIALFAAVEDVHDLTSAITVLLADADGVPIAVSGDVDEIPSPMRAVLSGKQLAAAGSVVALLSKVGAFQGPALNLSVFDAGHGHLLAILFDADADLVTVQTIGRDASSMITEILATL